MRWSAPALASGTIPGSAFSGELRVVADVSLFDLYFERGSQFALTLSGRRGPSYRWLAYRGEDAPRNRDFQLIGSDWWRSPLQPVYSDPPYSGGFSTFIELVPEPSTAIPAFFSEVVIAVKRRRRRPH